MKATWNDVVIAESDETIEIEGNQYFPADSLKEEFFTESEHTTSCHWKGQSNYYHVTVDGSTNENAAWYYPAALPSASEKVGTDFSNYVAFWNGVVVSE